MSLCFKTSAKTEVSGIPSPGEKKNNQGIKSQYSFALSKSFKVSSLGFVLHGDESTCDV